MPEPRIYLAGPDLFYPDAQARYAALKSMCSEAGLVGVAPSDGAPSEVPASPVGALRIYRHDIALLRSCDALLGNIYPFDSIEPDSGTAYEIGFAAALGMPIALYCEDGLSLRERIVAQGNTVGPDGRDGAGVLVEDFGLPANLMLCAAHPWFHTPEDAVLHLAQRLAHGAPAKKAAQSESFRRPEADDPRTIDDAVVQALRAACSTDSRAA
jgi:nucleoside 2-deoxyribosyltransferase